MLSLSIQLSKILQKFHDTPRCTGDTESEKCRIISAAAAIIRSETIEKCNIYDKEHYPDPTDLESAVKCWSFYRIH